MPYEKIYRGTKSRTEFMKAVRKVSPHVKKTSLIRYYNLNRQYCGEQSAPLEEDNVVFTGDVKQPSPLKMLQLQDMKKLNQNITPQFLFRHGFNRIEIEWLKQHNFV